MGNLFKAYPDKLTGASGKDTESLLIMRPCYFMEKQELKTALQEAMQLEKELQEFINNNQKRLQQVQYVINCLEQTINHIGSIYPQTQTEMERSN